MQRYPRRRQRRGATAVEFAVTAPIVFFFLLATMIGSLAVSRYQHVAALAREGSRWASVRGTEFEKETKQPAATADDVLNEVVLPAAGTLKAEYLTCEVTWDRSNVPLQVIDDVQNPVGNAVTVTVSYTWFPELLLVGPFTLTSSSTAQMIY